MPGHLDFPVFGIVGDGHRHEGHAVEPERQIAPCRKGAAGMARENLLKREALLRVGAVVDQKAKLPVLLEDVTFPMHDKDHGQVLGKFEVAIGAVMDEPGEDALTEPVGWV